MEEIAGVMMDATEQNFEEEGRPEKWVELADDTIEERTEEGTWPGKVLQRSGQLAASVTWLATSNQAVVGTNKIYAAIHQFGGEAGRKPARVQIPGRPFLGLTENDLKEIEEILKRYIDNIPK